MKIFFNSNAVFGILVMRFTQVDLNNVYDLTLMHCLALTNDFSLQVYAIISTYLKID